MTEMERFLGSQFFHASSVANSDGGKGGHHSAFFLANLCTLSMIIILWSVLLKEKRGGIVGNELCFLLVTGLESAMILVSLWIHHDEIRILDLIGVAHVVWGLQYLEFLNMSKNLLAYMLGCCGFVAIMCRYLPIGAPQAIVAALSGITATLPPVMTCLMGKQPEIREILITVIRVVGTVAESLKTVTIGELVRPSQTSIFYTVCSTWAILAGVVYVIRTARLVLRSMRRRRLLPNTALRELQAICKHMQKLTQRADGLVLEIQEEESMPHEFQVAQEVKKDLHECRTFINDRYRQVS